MKVYEQLLQIREEKGAGYLVLIDPDKQSMQEAIDLARVCSECGVDGLLLGGSLMFTHIFDDLIKGIKAVSPLPLIIFPGSTRQLSPYADAILYLSLISGRNAYYIIGDQVLAAPIIKSMNLEAISTAYMLIESGNITSAQFLSDTRPIPREKPDISVAHAMAAELLGMRMVYLEAGSGAQLSVPESHIAALCRHTSLPIIVGGGIRTPEEAARKVAAGASFIVTGNVIEKNRDRGLISSFAESIHTR
ncbi:MAG TPA: geranylgeranylglyceryl/heptaprenylglyceryl phosphate synthase [bacterium]|nr:geranylgeranylglyceryl/heptaprenylglyceryl phosphate synthase [bacterium]HOC88803.1 geranylgeranylglyceryl/heptaprenylglyceryl phosphate synthase [bacterium]HOZ21284.1 geranylgeranylglyceryl/heptaprenylglyceryl phosphate synthase [bacterium]